MKNKKQNTLVLLGLLMVCLLVIGVSYALWQLTLTQTDSNVVTTGCFKVEFTDQNPITLDKAYPITDEEGKSLTPYEFTLTNTCNDEATYYINLETITSATKKLSEEYLKVSLKKGETEVFESTLNSSYINLDKVIPESTNAYKIYQGKLNGNEAVTFHLNLWLDEDTEAIDEVMNATYEGKITVATSYRAPSETDNMMVAIKKGYKNYGSGDYVNFNETYIGENAKYSNILEKVVFQNKIAPYEGAEEIVDLSVNQDKTVLGYYVKNNTNDNYILYIQANGKIKANYDASYYFTPCVPGMCYDEYSFEGIENVDTHFTTNMHGLFYSSPSFNARDVTLLDTKNVTDMSDMFYSINITTLVLNSLDTRNVTNMSGMFNGMNNLTSLDLSSFNTSNVTDMSHMFENTSNLNSIIYSENFVHKEDTIIEGMYTDCPANKPTHESWNNLFS